MQFEIRNPNLCLDFIRDAVDPNFCLWWICLSAIYVFIYLHFLLCLAISYLRACLHGMSMYLCSDIKSRDYFLIPNPGFPFYQSRDPEIYCYLPEIYGLCLNELID